VAASEVVAEVVAEAVVEVEEDEDVVSMAVSAVRRIKVSVGTSSSLILYVLAGRQ
jgi:3-hydroxy-3-methylglutaryl CoA synthase